MDLQAAHDTNATTWKCARLAAVFFFAMACALLIASLTTISGSRAEANVARYTKAPAAMVTSYAQGFAARP